MTLRFAQGYVLVELSTRHLRCVAKISYISKNLRFKNTIVIALRASQFILIKPLMTRIFLMPRHRSKEICVNPRQSAVHWRSLRKAGGAGELGDHCEEPGGEWAELAKIVGKNSLPMPAAPTDRTISHKCR